MKARPQDEITIEELLQHRVWKSDLDEENYEKRQDETWIRPVASLPVDDLGNRIVATELVLANGVTLPGMLSNLDLRDALTNQEFLLVSVAKHGTWFHLARYFDFLYSTNSPSALADFLGLAIDQVFPISYDISSSAVGLPEVVKGMIPAEPARKLTKEEGFTLIFQPMTEDR